MPKPKRPPLVLVSPDIQPRGAEMADGAISLPDAYQEALLRAGSIPLAMPATIEPEIVAECVRRCDGVLLTGGEDIDPRIYGARVSPQVRNTIRVTPDHGRRDYRELLLLDQVFRQRKPLLAICRGHQVLNVALGGTLIPDLTSETPGVFNHRRPDRRRDIVHEVRLTANSLLSRITGRQSLGVNSTHHQGIGCVAKALKVSAFSSDGVIEALELAPEAASWLPFLLSVQWHPERLVDRYDEQLAVFRAFTEACDTKNL